MGERSLLDRILAPDSLSVHFQPVLDVRKPRPSTHYVESLIRGPSGTSVELPVILFEYARKKNKEAAVDRACVNAILRSARALRPDVSLGINVHASSLAMDEGFVAFLDGALKANHFCGRRLVIEVVEHAPPWNVHFHRKAVLASIVQLARPFGARVVAEGVQEPVDLAVVKRLGVTLAQGFLFGRPGPVAPGHSARGAGPAGAPSEAR